jgi:hypothetical protein
MNWYKKRLPEHQTNAWGMTDAEHAEVSYPSMEMTTQNCSAVLSARITNEAGETASG